MEPGSTNSLEAGSQQYHTVDPIDNLVLRVVVRYVRDATVADKADSFVVRQAVEAQAQAQPAKGERTLWMRDFQWQEKELSPHDLAVLTQAMSGSRAKLSQVQQDHLAMLERRMEAGERPLSALDRVHLFSYVDKDGHRGGGGADGGGETTSARGPTPLEEAVAGLDLRGGLHSGGSQSERRARRRLAGSGHLAREAASRVMYLMAAVDVDPADYRDPARAPASPRYGVSVLCRLRLYAGEQGAVLEARPPLARASPGGLLSTRRFTSAHGSLYEVAVYNAAAPQLDLLDPSGGPDASRMARIARLQSSQVAKAALATRRRFAGGITPALPAAAARMVFANAELCAAERFEGRSLSVEWSVHLPPERWQWANTQAPHAVAGVTQSSRVRRMDAVPAPHARTVPTGAARSGEGEAGPAMGARARVQDVRALYPPDGVPVAHFAMPIELELVERAADAEGPLHCSNKLPTVVVAVWSTDSLDAQRVEGYGAVALPTSPGIHNIRVRTWRPDGTLRQRMEDFLVGGSRVLEDSASAGADVAGKGFVNKLGLRTESSGDVHLRVNVVSTERPGESRESRPTSAGWAASRGEANAATAPAARQSRIDATLGRAPASSSLRASVQSAEDARAGTAALVAKLREQSQQFSGSGGESASGGRRTPGPVSAAVGRMASQRAGRLPPLGGGASPSDGAGAEGEDGSEGEEGGAARAHGGENPREARRRAMRERRRARRRRGGEEGE